MADFFTPWDVAVLFGYLILTTVIGHYMGGKQATIKDFFAGGKSLPWWAVSGSIIATEISGVTFIGVPGGVMAANGDFTYMLWGIGSVIGRVIVGVWFVKVFYEDEIYSPYDYMGKRIKPQLKTLATVFFTVGSILGQSVRVLVAALPLTVVTGWSFDLCILVIGVFAIGWTLMGGMRTVIWTDVMQFVLFTVGGLITVFWVVSSLDGGWATFWSEADAAGKTRMWNDDFGWGPAFNFTFWVAIIAVPFQNLTAFGVDQLNAQRMFCCRNAGDARKAIIFSSVGQALTYLMLLVGAALYVFYLNNPPEGVVADNLSFMKDGKPATLAEGGTPAAAAEVFPIWIVSELPPGLAGLILAGVFAAAISSLDSILAALSQTTISLIHHPENGAGKISQTQLVSQSRKWVVFWGITLTLFTLVMNYAREQLKIPILDLAFGMTTYTMGPLLGMFLCALWGKGSFRGILIGSVISFFITMMVRTDIWVIVERAGLDLNGWLSILPSYYLEGGQLKSSFNSSWMWPIGTILTVAGGLFGGRVFGTKEG
ncbi:MAG: sodium:solute symporter family transporter [Verrucomicrobiaceae bacterium]